MTQVFDENNRIVPVTVVKAGPCVVTQIRTQEKDGYTAVQLAYGADRPAQGDQAGRRPLQGRRASPRAGTWSSCAPTSIEGYEVGQELTAEVFDRRRLRRRHRHHQGQGHRRRHEAPRLPRPRRRPRRAAQAPLARLDRRLRHPGPRVQGRADGRPDGSRDARPRRA